MKKKTLIFAAGAVAAMALAPACGPLDEDPGTGDGDMGGSSGDGDGDGDGDMGGDGGDGDSSALCSDDITAPTPGGDGGAGAISCDEPALPDNDIEISGDYTDDYDGVLSFTNEGVNINGDMYFFSQIHNDADFAVALNGEAASFDPCAWSIFAWTEVDGSLYYCQSVFDAASECDALEADLPDASDLGGGCGAGNAWSELYPAD